MNSYELSTNWFEFSFQNPDRVKPLHTALYFYTIEKCNKMGWKQKFGFPTDQAMEAVGIKNYKTYIKGLLDLVDFGFIKIHQRSKNIHTSNIIEVVKNTNVTTNAHTKASQMHTPKQVHSTVSIDKLVNYKTYKLIKDNVSVVEDNLEKWIKSDTEEKNIISFDFDKFILFFAEVTGKKIRNTQSLRKLINDILKTKDYTENDVYSVVKVKTKEWKGKVNRDGKKLDAWLDPKTLFRKSNFDKYVREADNAGNLELFSTEDNLIRDEFGNVVGQKTDYADLAKYYGITEEEARKHYKPIN
jgi:uncharacterized phage protein (TIGR02220 family)